MHLQAGMTLQSTSDVSDSVFGGATILITQFDSQGAVGFVVNKPSNRKLNQLVEFKESIPFPLHVGGPVDEHHLFFIHQRPDLISGGTSVGKGIYMGGDFKKAVSCINNNMITTKDIRIFIGYCGWDEGDLEAEIMEGGWVITGEESFPFSV